MDDQAALLAIRAAEAADAWLKDPRDTKAYSDFVTAVLQFRAYRHPQLPTGDPADDELLDALADLSPPTPVGALLEGDDPRQIMGQIAEQLRRQK